MRRATIKWLGYSELGIHFYPRSPCGERPANRKCLDFGWCISIHALLAESDSLYTTWFPAARHFYPRSPCGERLNKINGGLRPAHISIHALLAESDSKPRRLKSRRWVFLSTLSLRRATVLSLPFGAVWIDFYPRSPCGERLNELLEQSASYNISIHALLAESDGTHY